MSPSTQSRSEASGDSTNDTCSDERSILALLSDLEVSLQASQQALLARDLVRMEHLTTKQSLLAQRLLTWWQKHERSAEDESPTVSPPVRSIAQRLLHLGRIQDALLGRAERSLCLVSRLVAGTGASYAPFHTSPAIASQHRLPSKEG